MVASRVSTNRGPLATFPAVNGVAVITGMVRLMSRSSVTEALPLLVTLELMAEIGLVFKTAFAESTADGVFAANAGSF